MKIRTLISICIIFCSALLSGQNTFIKTLGGSGDDEANGMIQTSDGNFILLGSTTSFGNGGQDGYVSKINGSAKEIWDKAVGGSGDEVFYSGLKLINEDLILVGSTNSYGNGGEDVFVIRMDRFGGVVWSRTFGGAENDLGFHIIPTTDGHVLIAGQTDSYGGGGTDIFLVKMDVNGNEIWSKAFGTSENEWFEGKGLSEDNTGNIIISGVFNVNGTSRDGFLMRLDADGGLISVNGYDGGAYDGFNGALIPSGTDLLSLGQTESWNGGNHAILMSSFEENGNLSWSKTIGLTGEDIKIGRVHRTSDGQLLVSGHIFTNHSSNSGDAFLAKIDNDANVIWAKTYGDVGIETLESAVDTDFGVLAFGRSNSYGIGDNDIFVVRADRFGTISGCSENINLVVSDVNPAVSASTFLNAEQSTVNIPVVSTENIDLEEAVICDGCSADDLVAGLYCETAPIICSIDCLDGFRGTLPNELLMPQPDPLCEGNGVPNNVSWFAFVAGSTSIDLSIIPTNCDTIFNDAGTMAQTIGIQAGIYDDCGFNNSIVCRTSGCMDLVAETIDLASDEFVVGQIYFLYVDGCGGSICDYEVVVNSAQQAFEIEEITTVSNSLGLNLNEDTLCLGASIEFTLDNFDQDVEFNWSIDPPTSNYPSGIHPTTDTSSVAFQFNEEGCFDIHVYAFNECDVSETRSFSLCVRPLEDEVFSDIEVCQECFPITLISPESGCIITEGGAPTILLEDPNGDGVPGWLGTSTVTGPGMVSHEVELANGCSYTQYVNVVEIPLSPREQFDHYFCLTDFPVQINGFTFNSPGDTRNITLDGEAASGCDSLISITAHAVDFLAIPSIGSCESGEVSLSIAVSNVMPQNYTSISYIWLDENLDVVTDADGIDSILVVNSVGTYSVEVSVEVDGTICPQTFGPFNVDIDNLAPVVPSIAYAPIDICASEMTAQIYVMSQNLGEGYTWSLWPELPFAFGASTDTIFVDVSGGTDFEFCVYAENGCGVSDDICETVIVHEAPGSDFTTVAEACVGENFLITYTGTSGTSSSADFNWDFDGGIIQNGADPNGAGPFEIQYPFSGNYTIGLVLTEYGCQSLPSEFEVEIVEPFIPPMIECERSSGMVTFSWDPTTVEEVDVIVNSGQTSFQLDGNTFWIDGLSSEEEVVVQFHFNAADPCGGALMTEFCSSLPCPTAELNLSMSAQDVCLDNDSDVVLEISIDGDDSGSGSWESPYISNDGTFQVNDAGVGSHAITYNYQINDCNYSIDTVLHIYAYPEAEITVNHSYCEEMGSNTIDVVSDQENTLILDSEAVGEFTGIELGIGQHVLEVVSPSGCISSYDIEIEDLGIENLQIVGNLEVLKGTTSTYEAFYDSSLEDVMITWVLAGDTLCVGCIEVDVVPEEDSQLCAYLDFGDGCREEYCLSIEIIEKTKLYLPNAFSPNNDGVNDYFTIHSNNNAVFIQEIMIFDRWGALVFNKEEFNVGEENYYWDGTKEGNYCEEGVYVYVITYRDESEIMQKVTGDITLIW